jgi:hypothetical protein
MRTLYLRNVPDDVVAGIERLAGREGLSVNAFVVRELRHVAARAENPALLADLPGFGLGADDIVAELEAGRSAR